MIAIVERLGRDISALAKTARASADRQTLRRTPGRSPAASGAPAGPGKTGGVQKLRSRNVDVVEEVSAFREAVLPLAPGARRQPHVHVGGQRHHPSGHAPAELPPGSPPASLQLPRLADPDAGRPRRHSLEDRLATGARSSSPTTAPAFRARTSHAIFEPMFSTKEGGRGMGLTIARGLVEQHGGTIEVIVDGRRRGAHFRIRLPRKRSRATLSDLR